MCLTWLLVIIYKILYPLLCIRVFLLYIIPSLCAQSSCVYRIPYVAYLHPRFRNDSIPHIIIMNIISAIILLYTLYSLWFLDLLFKNFNILFGSSSSGRTRTHTHTWQTICSSANGSTLADSLIMLAIAEREISGFIGRTSGRVEDKKMFYVLLIFTFSYKLWNMYAFGDI